MQEGKKFEYNWTMLDKVGRITFSFSLFFLFIYFFFLFSSHKNIDFKGFIDVFFFLPYKRAVYGAINEELGPILQI